MGDIYRRISSRGFVSSPGATGEADLGQILIDFLVWIEQDRNLTLCQAFKPQYDWYMPAFAAKENLASEFLGKREKKDSPYIEGSREGRRP